MTSSNNKLLVLGAGSWGTSLALVLARNGNTTWLWGRDSEQMKRLAVDRCNERFLPGVEFPETLIPISDLAVVDQDITNIVMAVPCSALRQALETVKSTFHNPLRICLSSKGLEPGSQLLGHEVVEQVFGDNAIVLVLSGPSFAKEVSAQLPTAVTIASNQLAVAEEFAGYFRNDHFRTYTHSDVIGVEIGGAVKNIMAIAAGIADGLGFGANTRAALITRGLAEILRLAMAMGAKQETFMGLAGLGDLVLTCTDDLSRNRRFGLALAKGQSVEQAEQDIGEAIEGINTAREVCLLANQFNVEMPISFQVLQVIEGNISPEQAVRNLLQREPKAEM